jgi:hypothetical protein
MASHHVRKQENLRLVPIRRTPDELAQIELVERVNRLAVRRQKPRRFYKLAAGELFPLRIVGRLAEDAVAAGCSEAEFLTAVMPVVGNLIRRKFGKGRAQIGHAA